jgi:hypothetical protein
MPPRRRRRDTPAGALVAGVVAVAAVAAAALAGYLADRGVGGSGCNECPPPAVAVAPGAVWVAQGTTLHRIDPGTGRIAWSRRVTRPSPDGAEEIAAVAPAPAGVWVAWRRGAALVRGRTGPVTRVPLEAPAVATPTLATVAGTTWLGGGGRVVALRAGGGASPTVRVAAPAAVEAAGAVLRVHTGTGDVHLDGRLGVRTTARPAPHPAARWVADPARGTLSPRGAAGAGTLEFPDLVRVVEAPDGAAYAVQSRHHMAVARVEADGPTLVWRTPIPPG